MPNVTSVVCHVSI